MKLLITTGLYPPDIGGPARQIERLSEDLAKAGFSVAVLTYGKPEKKKRNFKVFGVSRRWPLGLRQIIYAVKSFYLSFGADIIYTTDLYSPGYYSMLAAHLFNKKFVVRFAGDSAWESAVNLGLTQDDIVFFQKNPQDLYAERKKKRRTEILKSADVVVAVSNFMKNLAIQLGVLPERIKVIYNAVDFLPPFPQAKGSGKLSLVTAGRLMPWKGVNMLIEIMPQLVREFPELILKVIGDGSQKQYLMKLARTLKISDKIIFRGSLPSQELWQEFSESTIFVLNSQYEGLSHTILEAMSVGLPVIVSNMGGNPEIVENGKNGLLVPYNNHELWRGAISGLLKDEALRQKFTQEGKRTLEKFRWEILLQETIGVLKNLL